MGRDRLRILVYPHDMAMGGSQLNAIELAAATRDLGHSVAIVGDDGPLVRMVRDLGLRHIPVPASRRRPSIQVARDLRRLVRDEGIDIVHGYEWPPGLEAAAAVFRGPGRRRLHGDVDGGGAVPAALPAVGRRHAGDPGEDRGGRPGPVYLIEPPVDVVANAPDHPADATSGRITASAGRTLWTLLSSAAWCPSSSWKGC